MRVSHRTWVAAMATAPKFSTPLQGFLKRTKCRGNKISHKWATNTQCTIFLRWQREIVLRICKDRQEKKLRKGIGLFLTEIEYFIIPNADVRHFLYLIEKMSVLFYRGGFLYNPSYSPFIQPHRSLEKTNTRRAVTNIYARCQFLWHYSYCERGVLSYIIHIWLTMAPLVF